MNKYFRRVLNYLKTSKDVKALGFSKKELKSAAAKIADNLELEDDASDEDVDSAIEEAVENAMPFLKLAQSSASRQAKAIREQLRNQTVDDDDDDDDEETDVDDENLDSEGKTKGKSAKNGKGNKRNKTEKGNDGDTPEWAKGLLSEVTSLKNEISTLKGDKTKNARLEKVKDIVKNTGDWGKRVIRDFGRMNFEDEDAFEDYLDEIKEDLENENKERANKGLESLGPVESTGEHGSSQVSKTTKLLTDEQVKKLAKGESIDF